MGQKFKIALTHLSWKCFEQWSVLLHDRYLLCFWKVVKSDVVLWETSWGRCWCQIGQWQRISSNKSMGAYKYLYFLYSIFSKFQCCKFWKEFHERMSKMMSPDFPCLERKFYLGRVRSVRISMKNSSVGIWFQAKITTTQIAKATSWNFYRGDHPMGNLLGLPNLLHG